MTGLPDISARAFLILDVLQKAAEHVSAVNLRKELERRSGEIFDGAKFYQMMRRLISRKLLEKHTEVFDVGGGKVSRTFYQLTDAGAEEHRRTKVFYAAGE